MLCNYLRGERFLKGPVVSKLCQSEHLEVFFRSLKEAAICVDEHHCILALNSNAEAMFGYSSTEAFGQSFNFLLPSADHADHAAFAAIGALGSENKIITSPRDADIGEVGLNQFLERTDGAGLRVVEFQRKGGNRFHAETSVSSAFIVEPVVTVVLRDVTEQRRTARDNARLAALASSAAEAIMSIGRDGLITAWNRAAEQVSGYSHGELAGQDAALLEFFDDNGPLNFWREGHPLIPRETRAQMKRKDGEVISVAISVSPIQYNDPEFVGVCATIRDCTEDARHKKSDEFFLREICHRAKNNLAIISAIVRETAERCSSVENFETKLSSRIASLGYAYDALTRLNWRGADLQSLIECQLQPFCDTKAGQCHISGPPIILDAQVVQILGLALHELASNARQFGAFSSPYGKVDIAWRLGISDAGLPHVTLSWLETDGPPVNQHHERGFGSFVLEVLTNAALDADVRFSFEPPGIRWEIAIPGKYIDSIRNS